MSNPISLATMICGFGLIWPAAASAGTLETLQQAIERRESALGIFAVQLAITGTNVGRDNSGLLCTERWTIDGERARKDVLGESEETQDRTAKRQRTLAVYDGQESRVLYGAEGRKWSRGRASEKRAEAIPSPVGEVRMYLTHIDQVRGSQFLQDNPSKIIGRQEWNGRQVLEVEVGPFAHQGRQSAGLVRLLFDPEKGFALVRRSISYRRAPDRPWYEYAIYDIQELEEVKPGIWVPKRAHYRWGGAGENSKMLNRYDITFSQWNLKPDISDSVFQLKFPQGLVVTDMRRPNQGYIVGSDDDPNPTDR